MDFRYRPPPPPPPPNASASARSLATPTPPLGAYGAPYASPSPHGVVFVAPSTSANGGYRAPGAPASHAHANQVVWVSVDRRAWTGDGAGRDGDATATATATMTTMTTTKTTKTKEWNRASSLASTSSNERSNARAGKSKRGEAAPTPTRATAPTPTPTRATSEAATLTEDDRRYREERARNWPSERNVKAKAIAGDAEKAKERRRELLRDILAKQRELGHFEASQEIGEDGSMALGKDDKRAKNVKREREGETKGEEAKEEGEKRTANGNKACRFWLSGGCRKGSACDFKHEAAAGIESRCRFFAKGYCKAGEKCPFKHESRAPDDSKKANIGGGYAPSTASQQTLLRKLLSKEIEADQSRLLQLFRFFVNNDFFAGAKGNTESCWMFPWVDDARVMDARAELKNLPPVHDDDDDDDDEEKEIEMTEKEPTPPKESSPKSKVDDLGFFSTYDSMSDSGE